MKLPTTPWNSDGAGQISYVPHVVVYMLETLFFGKNMKKTL
jgi:hypothetical protein